MESSVAALLEPVARLIAARPEPAISTRTGVAHAFGRPTALAGDKIAAAMRLVADTAGLIVDLRDCHGGDTDTVALAQSYLVPARTHLLDMYTRDDNATEHVYATADLAGPRYLDKPVVILIGDSTASGCEAFAYAMQSRRRATLVGGPTAGAAYFGSPRRLTDHFMAFVPVGRPIDPTTQGDWEGGGVVPAVAAAAERALDAGELSLAAHARAARAVAAPSGCDAEAHRRARSALTALARPAAGRRSLDRGRAHHQDHT